MLCSLVAFVSRHGPGGAAGVALLRRFADDDNVVLGRVGAVQVRDLDPVLASAGQRAEEAVRAGAGDDGKATGRQQRDRRAVVGRVAPGSILIAASVAVPCSSLRLWMTMAFTFAVLTVAPNAFVAAPTRSRVSSAEAPASPAVAPGSGWPWPRRCQRQVVRLALGQAPPRGAQVDGLRAPPPGG